MVIGISIVDHLTLVASADNIYFDFSRNDPCRHLKAGHLGQELLGFEVLGKVAYRCAVLFKI